MSKQHTTDVDCLEVDCTKVVTGCLSVGIRYFFPLLNTDSFLKYGVQFVQ